MVVLVVAESVVVSSPVAVIPQEVLLLLLLLLLEMAVLLEEVDRTATEICDRRWAFFSRCVATICVALSVSIASFA